MGERRRYRDYDDPPDEYYLQRAIDETCRDIRKAFRRALCVERDDRGRFKRCAALQERPSHD